MSDEADPEGNCKPSANAVGAACLQSLQHLAAPVHREIILMSFGLSSRVRQPKSRGRDAPLEASTMVSFQRCHEVERHAARNTIDAHQRDIARNY